MPVPERVELRSGVAVIVRVEYTLPQAMPKSKPWRRDLGQSVPRIVTCGATQVKFAASSDFQSQASGAKEGRGLAAPLEHGAARFVAHQFSKAWTLCTYAKMAPSNGVDTITSADQR